MEKSEIQLQSADEYLRHAYRIPQDLPPLPLDDEAFVSQWQEMAGEKVLDYMQERLGLPAHNFQWERPECLLVSFCQTMGGKLPVITTGCHEDFRSMEALINGRPQRRELPLTVNAFTIQARAENIFRHRVLLLNQAPYSNVAADKLGLSEEEWLEHSYRLRMAHEGTHYETLRILGGMKNHALDEICADAMGQLAAFGNFDADRQRLFFGLEKGKNICTGRLSFYCQNVVQEERPKIYGAVDRLLDNVEAEIKNLLAKGTEAFDILMIIAGRRIDSSRRHS